MSTKRSNEQSKKPLSGAPPTGKLILAGLTAYGYHGHNPAERKLGQTFVADIEVLTDTQGAAASDNLADTISYPIIERVARQILEGKPAALLETVAERIAASILKEPRVAQVTVRVSKRPPLPNLTAFTVEITRPIEIANQRR